MKLFWNIFFILVFIALFGPILIWVFTQAVGVILPGLDIGALQHKVTESINGWAK